MLTCVYLQTWEHWGTATTLLVWIKLVRTGNPLIYMALASIFHLSSNPMHFLCIFLSNALHLHQKSTRNGKPSTSLRSHFYLPPLIQKYFACFLYVESICEINIHKPRGYGWVCLLNDPASDRTHALWQLWNLCYSMLVLKSLGQILCICQSLQVGRFYKGFSCGHMFSHSQSKPGTALPERQLWNQSTLLCAGSEGTPHSWAQLHWLD